MAQIHRYARILVTRGDGTPFHVALVSLSTGTCLEINDVANRIWEGGDLSHPTHMTWTCPILSTSPFDNVLEAHSTPQEEFEWRREVRKKMGIDTVRFPLLSPRGNINIITFVVDFVSRHYESHDRETIIYFTEMYLVRSVASAFMDAANTKRS